MADRDVLLRLAVASGRRWRAVAIRRRTGAAYGAVVGLLQVVPLVVLCDQADEPWTRGATAVVAAMSVSLVWVCGRAARQAVNL